MNKSAKQYREERDSKIMAAFNSGVLRKQLGGLFNLTESGIKKVLVRERKKHQTSKNDLVNK